MLLNLHVSFLWGLLRGKQYFSLCSFLHCDFLEVKYTKSWYFRDNKQAVIRHLCNNIVCESQPLKLLTVRQLSYFLKIRYFVIHKKNVLQIHKRLSKVLSNSLDSIVRSNDRCQSIKIREVAQFTDLIITKINALEEVLSQEELREWLPCSQLL